MRQEPFLKMAYLVDRLADEAAEQAEQENRRKRTEAFRRLRSGFRE